MNCPYCKRDIHALTGLQELRKFETHLNRCRKKPRAVTIIDGKQFDRRFNLNDALEIRAMSGQ